jgi:hypothetical protein
MPNGREVYTSLCIDYTPIRPISEIITMHIDKETRYSYELDEFITLVPCSNIVDLDGDGKPDTSLGSIAGSQTQVTYDDDSINIDIDGDGAADIVISKG